MSLQRNFRGGHLDIQRATAQHARQLRALPPRAAHVAAVGRHVTGFLHFLCAELKVCHLQQWLPAIHPITQNPKNKGKP